MGNFKRILALTAATAVALAVLASSSLAATNYTSVASGNWIDDTGVGGTWNQDTVAPYYPTAGNNATVSGGCEVIINTGGLGSNSLTIGSGTDGTVTVNGGSLTLSMRLTLGNPASLGGAGTFNLIDGTVIDTAGGTYGDYDYNNTNSRAMRLGYGGAANFNQYGGVFEQSCINDFADYGTSAYSKAPVAMTISGGVFRTKSINIELGGYAGGCDVTWTVGGGAGPALFVQLGGTGGYFSKGGKATVNLETNGTMTIAGITLGNGGTSDSSFNFNGGTLQAAAGANILPGTIFAGGTRASVYIKEGGAILDSNSFSASISANMLHGGGDATDGGVTKVGAGTWTLSGANTYTGDTAVSEGTLSITQPFLADSADVYLTTGAFFDLAFAGIDTIDELFFDGAGQASGTWGCIGSGADNESDFFTGDGLLYVTTGGTILPDANNDGLVNSADYIILKKNIGMASGATWEQGDFDGDGDVDWGDLGMLTAAMGGAGGASPVPEPATLFVMAAAGLAALLKRRRCRS